MRPNVMYTAKNAMHSGRCGIKLSCNSLKIVHQKGFRQVTVFIYSYNFSHETRQRSAEVNPPAGSGSGAHSVLAL
jgi:hypothetical protein